MIKINRESDVTLLSAAVTDFADSLGYCEYKIPLSIQGIKPKPSPALIQGTKAHHAEEKYEAEHVELEPVSIQQIENKEENIEFARENIHSTLMMPFDLEMELKEEQIKNWFTHFGVIKKDQDWHQIHVSGHGDGTQIKQVIDGSNAKKIIPIHTQHDEYHKKWHGNVQSVKQHDSVNL